MPFPSSDVVTTNLDAPTDSPATARADLLDLATKFNQLRNFAAPTAVGKVSQTTLANFSFVNTGLTEALQIFPTTNPAGWNTGAGRKTVDFEFVSTGYFANCPGGHVAVICRCDASVATTSNRGQGAIMGNLTWSGFNGDEALFAPTTIIETWNHLKTPAERWLFPHTTGPRNLPLLDGRRYRWIIETTKTESGERYIRYRLYRWTDAPKLAWDLHVDTGDVLDHNTGADLTQEGLVFGHVFADNLGAWNIAFSNIKVTWGPPGQVQTDHAAKAAKFGADVIGDLNFVGAARRIRAPSSPGPSLLDFLTFQAATLNSATTIVYKPNGSATTANTLWSNNGTSDTVYQCVSMGMAGGRAVIEAFSRGSSDPGIDIKVGVGNTIISFDNSGAALAGASRYLGTPLPYFAGVTTMGGANAVAFASSAFDIESLCTPGTLASFMSASPSNGQVENLLRPLYCFVSGHWAFLKSKKLL